jgi:hypothetical protein
MTAIKLPETCNFAGPTLDRRSVSDEIPAIIRAELNADIDRDLMARMGHLARKRRLRQPVITEEEMADYLALAENFENHAQWVSARRGTLKRPLRATVAWVVATSAILGLLTAMLIVGISIAV